MQPQVNRAEKRSDGKTLCAVKRTSGIDKQNFQMWLHGYLP
jgi:hypothetical protein